MYEFVYTLDREIFQWFNSWAGINPFFDWAIVFRATYLWYLVMAAVVLFVVITFFPRWRGYRKRHTKLLIFAFVSAVMARFVITELIRFFYNRPRPFEAIEGVYQLVDHAAGKSFPSGHAALSFAVATAVSLYYPKTGIFFFLAAFSIGFSRVAAGVHWPSDIIGGALVGIGTAIVMRWAVRKSAARGVKLFYDGQCGFCQYAISFVTSVDIFDVVNAIDVIPLRDEEIVSLPFRVTREQFLEEIHLVTPRGKILKGFFAFRHLAWFIPLWWFLLPILWFPGASFFGPRAYRWIARNRYAICRSCAVPDTRKWN